MTYAEAQQLLTPEQQAQVDELVADAPPLSEATKTLLAAVFAAHPEPAAA